MNWTISESFPAKGEAEILGEGFWVVAVITIRLEEVIESFPPGPMTMSLTEKLPVVVKSWRGFLLVSVVPSPKLQSLEVIVPVEESVNWTLSESFPVVGEADIFGEGFGGVAVMVIRFGKVTESFPPGPITTSFTEKLPIDA